MTVKELKELLDKLDDEAEVTIYHSWYNGGDDSYSYDEPVLYTDGRDLYMAPATSTPNQSLDFAVTRNRNLLRVRDL